MQPTLSFREQFKNARRLPWQRSVSAGFRCSVQTHVKAMPHSAAARLIARKHLHTAVRHVMLPHAKRGI